MLYENINCSLQNMEWHPSRWKQPTRQLDWHKRGFSRNVFKRAKSTDLGTFKVLTQSPNPTLAYTMGVRTTNFLAGGHVFYMGVSCFLSTTDKVAFCKPGKYEKERNWTLRPKFIYVQKYLEYVLYGKKPESFWLETNTQTYEGGIRMSHDSQWTRSNHDASWCSDYSFTTGEGATHLNQWFLVRGMV